AAALAREGRQLQLTTGGGDDPPPLQDRHRRPDREGSGSPGDGVAQNAAVEGELPRCHSFTGVVSPDGGQRIGFRSPPPTHRPACLTSVAPAGAASHLPAAAAVVGESRPCVLPAGRRPLAHPLAHLVAALPSPGITGSRRFLPAPPSSTAPSS